MENQQQHNNHEGNEWVCSCGRVNDKNYCCDCGFPKPGAVQAENQTDTAGNQLNNQPTFANPTQLSPAPVMPKIQPKEKMSKLKLILIILAFIATFGFQALMYSSFFGTLSHGLEEVLYNSYYYDYLDDEFLDREDLFEDSAQSSEDQIAYSNEQFREYYRFQSNSTDPISSSEINSVATDFYANQTKNGSDYSPGVYTVGTDIEPGRYLIYGTQKEISTFFVLKKHEESDSFDVVVLNIYYGNNQIDLAAEDVLICDSSQGFCSKSDYSSSYSSPYKSGVYEVGKDIPAGTYTLNVGEANDYSAYYVMKDLNYTDESVIDSKVSYFMNEKMELKLTEGTFVEFYNITAKSGGTSSAAFA